MTDSLSSLKLDNDHRCKKRIRETKKKARPGEFAEIILIALSHYMFTNAFYSYSNENCNVEVISLKIAIILSFQFQSCTKIIADRYVETPNSSNYYFVVHYYEDIMIKSLFVFFQNWIKRRGINFNTLIVSTNSRSSLIILKEYL